MRRSFPYFIFGILLLFAACAKEQVELVRGADEPVFKMTASFDNDSIVIEAGRNDYYLFTDNGLSVIGDVFHPLSTFEKLESCETDCLESFSLKINNIPVYEVGQYFGTDPALDKLRLDVPSNQPGYVILTYTNANGQFYSSALGVQNNDLTFTVTDIAAYDKNEKGQTTKRLQIEFNCLLFNESGESIAVNNGSLTVAIALP